ncbi:retroviral-like aspartic protease family protein, partial [Cellulophaga baltica]|uniref:retropepsin-like aspartic protease n=1 Tax=Cellulophaga TaxID=104264 RepID=UPI001C068DFF
MKKNKMSLKRFLKNKGFIKTDLKLTKTNHFEIKASINGISGIFILDTGASNTCIGIDKTEKFKLNYKKSKIKAAGAGATNMDTHISKR